MTTSIDELIKQTVSDQLRSALHSMQDKALTAGEVPGSHWPTLTSFSEEVGAVVKDVFVRLGHTDLLGRCLMGKKQNSNESLHSVVWRKCPKKQQVQLCENSNLA